MENPTQRAAQNDTAVVKFDGEAQTPMSDHVASFWKLLATEHVRILIDIRRDHDEGQSPHWDSSSFGNDVAKVLVAERAKMEKERNEARFAVQYLIDHIEYSDSYGVEGSGFQSCHLCSGGGAPHVMLVHEPGCPVSRYEKVSEEWEEERRAELEAELDHSRRCPTPPSKLGFP